MSQNDQTRREEQRQDPTPPVVRLASAEVDVAAAKDRLNDTVARLQSKLDPKLLAKEATDEAKRVGEKGVAYARDNQAIIGGLAGGALIYLIGRPLLRLIFRRRKYPKPQKAAKPMTATAPNKRLAARPHPTQAAQAPMPPQAVTPPQAPPTPKAPLAPAHPTMTTAPAAQSNEGAQLQGTHA
ncbi:hypothetical protein [Sphingomonas lenta]|uniref:DUF3618 domain-containing protein n=1 Tax=Sphingomonas lenta TaxID=1141887 RepID=A0A2A2SJG1_9SPHN|nr:hypothetical protein [Sphingomonas lenta]PAX09376.1 hypothetical protein CKY28_01070 [Sphingomonas lenta]